MEANDWELRNEMDCASKFHYRLNKKPQETVKLMKEAYKEKRFDESKIFRWYGDFKEVHLSTELAPKS